MRRGFAEGRIESSVAFVLPVLCDGSRQRDRSHVAAQFGAETLTELLDGQIPFNAPADREADGSGFLGAYDGDGVGFLSDADASAVSSPELSGQQRIHGKRKKASSGSNPIFLHDDGAIMQRGAGTENGSEQVVGKSGIERDAAFDMGAQADFAFDDDQSSGLMLRKKIRGEDDVVVGIAVSRRGSEERQAPAEISEHVTYLRLKYDDQGKDYVGQNVADNPVERGKFADACKVERDSDYHQADQHGYGSRAADHHQDLINQKGDEEDIESDPRALLPGCNDGQQLSFRS